MYFNHIHMCIQRTKKDTSKKEVLFAEKKKILRRNKNMNKNKPLNLDVVKIILLKNYYYYDYNSNII